MLVNGFPHVFLATLGVAGVGFRDAERNHFQGTLTPALSHREREFLAELDPLTGGVEIGVLAHLALHFLALFFVIEQNFAVAEMAPLDLALRFID
jgi:hypothetical protein